MTLSPLPTKPPILIEPKSGGGFRGVGAVVSGGTGSISWSGTVAHGETLTITDSESRFGSRANAKPLYVWKGDGSKAGSALGRDTSTKWDSTSVLATDQPLGSLANVIKWDITSGFLNRLFHTLSFNGEKSQFLYIDRFYQKDITDPANFGSDGAYNLKTNRWFGGAGTGGTTSDNNVYVGYQGNQGAGSARIGKEFLDNNLNASYGQTVPPQVWLSEEYYLKNSSAPGVRDGEVRHYRNNVWLNSLAEDYFATTIDSDHPTKLQSFWLDQVSNQSGMPTPQYIWAGLMIVDDEPNAVYLGNAATRGACTKLVRQPQKTWSPSEVSIELVEGAAPVSGAYLYFRKGVDSWVSDDGVQI